MSVKVSRKHPDAIQKVFARLFKSGEQEIAVGFPRGKTNAYPVSGESVPEIAARHVYGIGVPPRDFMSEARGRIINKTKDLIALAAKLEAQGKSAEAAAIREAAGLAGADAIKDAIIEGRYDPLAPATIEIRKQKGIHSIKPLVESGHMTRSVTHIVRTAGGK